MAKKRNVKIKQNQREKYFSKLFENLSDFVVVVNAEGKINYATPSVQKILGEKAEDLLGEFAFRFVHPDDLARIKAEYEELITKPVLLQETNFRVISTDGSVRHIRGFRQNLLDDPEIQGIILTVHDTTEHFLLNQKLLQQQNLLNEVEEISNVGGWEWDIKTEKMYWTKETYRIHDFEHDESGAGTREQIKKSIECYSIEDQKRISEAFNDCVAKGIPYDLECRFTSASGQQKWVRTIGKPAFENDKIVKVIGNFIDITKNKREELLSKAGLNLVEYSYKSSLDEFLQKLLDEAEKLTESKIGFFHFVNDDQETLTLQVWSTNTLESKCTAEGKGFHYNISDAGVWVDCFQKHEAVIHNNYEGLPNKKGMPEGHAEVIRELVIPLIRNEKVVAIIGIGNKENDYTEQDIDDITKLANWAWDISKRKIAEEKLKESENRVRIKLQSLLDPEDTTENLELEDIINSNAIQSLMDKFYNLTGLPVAVLDLKGKILVGTGWQNICTKFHRVNTKTLNNCIECDTILTSGVKPGIYKDYLCKNNLWDAVTPIYIGGKHMGNLFTGQFFYDDAIPEKEVFVKQAEEYGFNLKDYLAALDEVPIFSRDKIKTVMAFYIELAEMISQLSYSNIKLARALSDRDNFVKSFEKIRQKEILRNKELEEAREATLNIIEDLSLEIIQRKETEDKLRKSEERFQYAAKATDDIIYDWDVTIKKAVFSHNYSKVLGYSIQKETSKDFIEKIHPEDRETTLEYTDSIIYGGGDSYNCEYRFKRSNGNYAHLLDRGYVVRDPNGNPKRLIGSLMDLTKQKDVEQELIDSREKFSQLVIQMDQGLAVHEAILDLNGNMVDYKFIDMNNSYERITGLKKSNLIGKTVLEALPGTETHWIERFGEVVKTGKSLHYENYSKELGKFFGVVAYRNRKNQFAVIISDITERKQMELALQESEARLKSIFKSASIGIGLVVDRVFLQVNEMFCEITGYTAEEIIGNNARIIYPSDEEFEFVGREKYDQISKKGTGTVETRWKRKDNKIIDILLSSTPIDTNDLSRGVTFTALDITERVAMEQEIYRFKAISDNAVYGHAITDINGNFIYINRFFANIHGYTQEELIGKHLSVFHSQKQLVAVEATLKQLVNRGNFEPLELWHVHRDGTEFPMLMSGLILTDNLGNAKYLAASAIDMTYYHKVEKNYKNLFNEMQEGFALHEIIVDDEGNPVDYRFLAINPAFERLTGLKNEEIIGRTVLEVLPGTEKYWIRNYGKVALIGESVSFQSYSAAIGKYFEVSAFCPNLGQFATIFQDITDRIKVEQALKESEIKYRTVADYNYAWEYWLDTNKKYIYNSPSCERITGYSIEELGNDLQPTINIIHPDDRETMHNHYNEEDLSFRKEFESIEFRIITKNGETKWISHICRKVYDNDNNFIGIRGSNRDITEEKNYKIELEKHSHAIEQSPVSIVITDVNGNIEYVNPMFSKITGYTFKEVKGENPRILKSGKQSDEFYKGLWQTITTGNIWAGVLHNKKKNGELFWESAIISPIKNEKEIITNFIAVKEDITEDVKRDEELKNYRENLEQLVKQRTGELDTVNKELKLQLDRSKILEKQLQESLSKEKEINELKTRFIATVSHEFRTPLSALLSSSQMIQRYSKNWSEEKLKQHYNRIESTVKYLTHILDDVLTISRADREILKNNPELCDINDLLNSFVEDIKPQLTEKHQLILDINCNKDEINIDRNLLRHIIINLLSNAVKYSPNGSIVNLTAKCTEEEIIISISDQGLGISENEIKYIFDPFFRANNSVGIQGTGLGLNIVKRALEILKGEISVVC